MAEIGRIGGLRKTKAKKLAARKNGLKGGRPLKRKTPLKRGKPLKNMSVKMEAKTKIYRVLRKQFLLDHPLCQACSKVDPEGPINASSQIHHMKRRGKHHNDVESWLAVCDPCHKYIERFPKWSRANGFLK